MAASRAPSAMARTVMRLGALGGPGDGDADRAGGPARQGGGC